MAVDMLCEVDKQFFYDNMLTDEDFQFDISSNFDVSSEENLLKCLREDELTEDVIQDDSRSSGSQNEEHHFSVKYSPEPLSSPPYHMEIKVEPFSPYSSSASSPENVWTPEIDVPVISIPDSSADASTALLLADTPPNTPPSMTECMTNTTSVMEKSILQTVGSTGSVSVASTSPSIISQPAVNVIIPGFPLQTKPVINNTTVSPSSGSCNPLILTPEQFAKFTAGTLKIKTASKVGTQTPLNSRSSSVLQSSDKPVKSTKTRCSPFNAGEKVVSKNGFVKLSSVADVTALKRQQRMIKNRESACLSRKRKKAYLQKLENEVKEISKENARLKMENAHLKQRVCELENEKQSLIKLLPQKAVKKTTCLMIILFLFSMNFKDPLGGFFSGKDGSTHLARPVNHHVGRTLLWDAEDTDKAERNMTSKFVKPFHINDNEVPTVYSNEWENENSSSMCPTFINRTESLRLENDLRGWVQRVEKKQKLKESKLEQTVKDKQNILPIPKLQLWKKKKIDMKDSWLRRRGGNEIQVYETPRRSYEDFFDAIHRRDDTFYFVSFSGDHLLLPATAHNKTLRPRMSLVMPAMTFNDTVGTLNEHISMMQIDCEVMNTKLVYVKESVIPEHLRQKQNGTEAPQDDKPYQYSVPRKLRGLSKSKPSN